MPISSGITLRTGERISFDLELVPVIQNGPLHVDLTVHPGVIVSVVDRLSLGLRMAFDVGRPSWGFTPLVNRSFALTNSTSLFGELVVPIRFQIDPAGYSQDRRSGDFETLERTWNVVVTPVGRPGAQILATYARAGTVVADGNAAQPALRGPWHGVWEPGPHA